jgi:hypothetical protein
MAKPYRRRKGKRGPFVGNFRVTIDGRDINLGTKDAEEAQHRARLASKGQWPADEAAARAAAHVLDPAADPGLPPAAEMVAEKGGGAPQPERAEAPASPPVTHAPPPAGTSAPPPEPLQDAAAAAAGEASGAGARLADEAAAAEAVTAADVDAEVRAAMSELVGPGGDLLDTAADGAGALLLWAEGFALKHGIRWTTGLKLRPGQSEPGSMARKCLRVGFKALAIQYIPDLAQNLSPGWAIVIGLGFGAKDALIGATIETKDADGKPVEVSAADLIAQQQQQQQQSAPPA